MNSTFNHNTQNIADQSSCLSEPLAISVIIPVHNESDIITATIQSTIEAVSPLSVKFEIIIIDDGSTDNTWPALEAMAAPNDRIKLLRFSRRFGKESAILAGLAYSSGEAVVVMDGDLQHPPRLIPEMYQLWKKEGYQVVHAVKLKRQQETFVKRLFARLFYAIIRFLSGYNLNQATDYKLLDQRVVRLYTALPEHLRFFRGLIPWLGFRATSVFFSPHDRFQGRSKWSHLALVTLAMRAICSFSALPMQIVTLMGIGMFFGSFILGIQTLFIKFSGQAVEGFTTVILLLLFMGSILMVSLGVIGQYIAMIYEEVKHRPPFIIDKMVNLGEVEGERCKV